MSLLEQQLEESKAIIHKLREENLELQRQLQEFKRLIFGKKNERFIATDAAQQTLFDETQADSQEPTTDTQTVKYQRNKPSKDKKKPVRALLPADLPREEIIIEPDEKHEKAIKIGEAVTEILEYKPGIMYVRRIVRPKYLQPSKDQPVNEGKKIVVAPIPTLPIPSGNAGPSLLAYLFISKFVDHLPFYRLVQMFKRSGIQLSESTISGWFKAVCKLLEPLYEELKAQILASEYLMGDETTLPVQSSQKPGATHTGYMWVYRSVEKLVIFDYQKNRSGQAPATLLADYKGTLQCDGYAGYEQFEHHPNITLIGCMAHARRYFEKAMDNDRERASHVLTEIQKLYTIERCARENEILGEQLAEKRQKEAIPILESLHEWMQEHYTQVAPKSSIGKAIAYSLRLWDRLIRYTENGTWNIDNNLVENSIRPVALGRKNYLFAGSQEAAQRIAMMYSFFGSCKMNNVDPQAWLTDVLAKIPDTKLQQLSKLLPNDTQYQ